MSKIVDSIIEGADIREALAIQPVAGDVQAQAKTVADMANALAADWVNFSRALVKLGAMNVKDDKALKDLLETNYPFKNQFIGAKDDLKQWLILLADKLEETV